MFLDAVRQSGGDTGVAANGSSPATARLGAQEKEVFAKWRHWSASEISHHGKICCEIAKEWLISTDMSELRDQSALTGPRWVRRVFEWGPSRFPINWCEVVRKKTLDCGALAALTHEIFTARGLKSVRVQMVQRFSETATRQWTDSWGDENVPLRWTDKDLIYHEGCAILTGATEVKVWDSSAGWWVDPNQGNGYGSLLAVRLSSRGLSQNSVYHWGRHEIPASKWTSLIHARPIAPPS